MFHYALQVVKGPEKGGIFIWDQAFFSQMASEVAMKLQAWFFEVAVG